MVSRQSLVTGGSGFIGQHLVRQLSERGTSVRVLDVKKPATGSPKGVQFIQGSVLDKASLALALDGADTLYHLAANPHLWAKDKKVFLRLNYEGTKLVLQQAAKANLDRIIYTSTEAILGSYRQPPKSLISEETPLPKLEEMPGPYTQSKMLAELKARGWIEKGLPLSIVYPSTPVGSGDVNLTASTAMIRDFLNGKNPAYYNCTLNWIAVEDVALGHILGAEKGRIGERYILGNENCSLSRILNILEENLGVQMPKRRIPYSLALGAARVAEFVSNHLTGKEPVASLEGVRLAKAGLELDCRKAREELGLPQTSIEKAILATAEWLKDAGHLARTW